MKPGDQVKIPEDGTRLARWRADMDAWAQTNVVGQQVSETLNAIIRARGEQRLHQLFIAADLTVEGWHSCPADAEGKVGGWTKPFCTYSQPDAGKCPTHDCKLTPGVVPHLHVELQDAWKVQRTRMWALRPFLPMKRYNEDESVDKTYGVLAEGLGPRVFLRQVFELGDTSLAELEEGPTMTYESVPQMLGDGWLVD